MRASPYRAAVVAGLLVALAPSFPAGARAGPPVASLQAPRYTRAQMEAAIPASPAFRFVYGTRDPAATPVLRARALALAQRAFGLDSTRVFADRAVDEKTFASGPVYLLGGSGENEWTARLAEALPVRFEGRGFRWQGRLYDRAQDAIHLSYPNPLAPRWFLLLSAGNSPEALARRDGFSFGEEDWRIVRGTELLRTGTFAQDGGRPWRYDPARDRDREAERERFARGLRSRAGDGVVVRAPGDAAGVEATRAAASALLARLARHGLAPPAGTAPAQLTLYRSLEEKGAFTRDTRPEHVSATAAHAARPAGRDTLDLWSVAAVRLLQLGASEGSRFLEPAAVELAGRFEGESFERSLARLYFGGVLPSAHDAATRGTRWRSPLVWIPARALLARAVRETAAPAARREAVVALLRHDPPGSLDSLCRLARVTAGDVERRYRALADSLARRGRETAARERHEPWRPAGGFQRGVCVTHRTGLEQGYLSRECARELAKVREAGADWVALTPFAWVADPERPEVGVSANAGPDGESDEAIGEAAARARALGLRVWLKPHVWTRGWAGDLSFSPAEWPRFFAGYEAALVHWAILAEREGLAGLHVGHELPSATAADPARWRAMIATVRRIYGGTLSYAANWDEVAAVPFWDALDLIGVSFYAPLAAAPTDDPRALRRGAERALAGLGELSRRYGRPVLLAELGYAPGPNAAVRPWEEPRGAADEAMQAACYTATIAALDPLEWVAGAYFWKWGSSARATDPFDPRGRPAGAVMARALREWQGRPVRVPAAEPAAAGRAGKGKKKEGRR
jgi:hypothetical protein